MKKILIPLGIVLALVLGVTGYIIYESNRARADFKPPEVDLGENVSSDSYRFLFALLGRLGYDVKPMYWPFMRADYSLIIREYREDADEVKEWADWLAPGKRLILLCRNGSLLKRRALPVRLYHPLFEGVSKLYLDPDCTLEDFEFIPEAAGRVTLFAERDTPLIARETYHGGEIIFIADSAVWSDLSLVKGDNAFFLNNCLKDHFRDPIVFDYSHRQSRTARSRTAPTAEGKPEPPFILFRVPFLYLFFEFLLLGLVFCLVFWKRFGPPRDAEQFAKRSLRRHLEAAGNFFEKTKNPLVFVDILDRHFLSRVRDLLRPAAGAKADLKAETKKRLHLTVREEEVFTLASTHRLVLRDDERERIIQRLKGVDKHHG